jgi:predicted nucleic acid-binding protein
LILVDTSIWIKHFRSRIDGLVSLLEDNRVAIHEFVIGELACGQIKNRDEILFLLSRLPRIDTLPHDNVLFLVQERKLFASGIGWVDSHLLAAALTAQCQIWTLDKSLIQVAKKCSALFE